jgi:hypothetical protein
MESNGGTFPGFPVEFPGVGDFMRPRLAGTAHAGVAGAMLQEIWAVRLYRPTYTTGNMGIRSLLSCLTGVWSYRTERADRRLWVAASSM